MIEKLRQFLFTRGYRLFMRPFELNIVGVRSKSTVPNSFDDTIHVFYMDGTANWRHLSFPATTDPGTHWLKNPMNENGTAILKPGQYLGAYQIGLHRGKYQALVQRKPVTVYRDFDRNNILDFSGAKQETGMFGINIHRAMPTGITQVVEKHSAGCQVFANVDHFTTFMRLCEAHKQRYGNSFTYTLLDDTFSQTNNTAMAA